MKKTSPFTNMVQFTVHKHRTSIHTMINNLLRDWFHVFEQFTKCSDVSMQQNIEPLRANINGCADWSLLSLDVISSVCNPSWKIVSHNFLHVCGVDYVLVNFGDEFILFYTIWRRGLGLYWLVMMVDADETEPAYISHYVTYSSFVVWIFLCFASWIIHKYVILKL